MQINSQILLIPNSELIQMYEIMRAWLSQNEINEK